MKIMLIILVVLIFLLPLVVFYNSRRITKLETIKVVGPYDVDYIEVIYGGVDEFIRVGQRVTLLNHPKYKGLIGKPMTIIAVDKPFVAIRWLDLLGDEITDNIDLRECKLMPITDNYFVANRTEIVGGVLTEIAGKNGWKFYDFRVQYVMPGAYDPNDIAMAVEGEPE